MKKYKKYMIFALLFLPMASCNILNLYPEDYYAVGTFWKSEAQVNGFITGLHTDMRSNYTRFYLLGEVRGGTMVSGNSIVNTSPNYASPQKNNAFTANSTGYTSWAGIYGSLMQVNLAITELETGCTFLTTQERNKFLGTAYGIRALWYFMLYKTYGGVPLIDKVKILDGKIYAEKLYQPRAKASEILAFIKSDIAKSEAAYGDNTQYETTHSLWSKYATLMLKADVYLWAAKVSVGDQAAGATADLNIAKTALDPIVNGTQYKLMPDFINVFRIKNAANTETIFALRFMDKEATNFGSSFVSADNVFVNQVYLRDHTLMTPEKEVQMINAKSTGLLREAYKYSFFAYFDPEDLRRDATFVDVYTSSDGGKTFNNGGVVTLKLMGEINSEANRVYNTDWQVYRLAEAYLMMAEIENKLGNDPSPWINKVRERAYGANYQKHVHTNQGFAANELAILKERDCEFVAEGKRWFDIVRMQDAAQQPLAFSAVVNFTEAYPVQPANLPVIGTNEKFKLLWPVDITTLNNDPLLEQTPGY